MITKHSAKTCVRVLWWGLHIQRSVFVFLILPHLLASLSFRCSTGWPSRDWKDSTGQSGGRRGRCAVLLRLRVRVWRDVRWSGSQPHQEPFQWDYYFNIKIDLPAGFLFSETTWECRVDSSCMIVATTLIIIVVLNIVVHVFLFYFLFPGEAKANTPCVIFIDELDSVGGKRIESPMHPYSRQTINQLLAEMDG